MKYILAFLILTSVAFAGKGWIATELALATMYQNEKVARSECDECNGTGKIKAGDGNTIVWRECTNCYPDQEPNTEIQKLISEIKDSCKCDPCICDPCECTNCDCNPDRWLLFTASWCKPCQVVKKNLKEEGFKFGKTEKVQLIDVDDYPKIKRDFKVRVLPTFIRLKDGKRLTGVIDGEALSGEKSQGKPLNRGANLD